MIDLILSIICLVNAFFLGFWFCDYGHKQGWGKRNDNK